MSRGSTPKPRADDITLLKEVIPSSSTNDDRQDTVVKVKRKKKKVELLIVTSSITKNIDGDRLFRHKKVESSGS